MQNQKLQIKKTTICLLIESTKKRGADTSDITSSVDCKLTTNY
jgi:hypothetical protein